MLRLHRVAFIAFVFCVVAVIGIALTGCAAWSGRAQHVGPPIVTVEHDHRGACWGRDACMRTLYVRNGTNRAITFNVSCADGEWIDYQLPPREDQGFAEFNGECRVSKWYGWLDEVR